MKKQVKFYYVYIITNMISNKQYVGSRKCYKNKIEDDYYWGSSKYLSADINNYGICNFKKEILKENCKDKIDMLNTETEYILKYNTLSPNGYNRFLPNNKYGFYSNGQSLYNIWINKYGKKIADEKIKIYGEKIRKALSKKKRSKYIKITDNTPGPWNKGKHGIYSKEYLEKLRVPNTIEQNYNVKIAMSKMPELECPYCKKKMTNKNGAYTLYHGTNCKLNPANINSI